MSAASSFPFRCGHCDRERCDRATMVVIPLPPEQELGPRGRPVVGVTTACPHGSWGWAWEAPSDPITAADEALLVGQAGQDHYRRFGCPCFADRARVRVGLPDAWHESVGLVHQPLGPLQ